VIRLLKVKGEIDPKWRERLTSLFGTPDWEPHFYTQETEIDLFGETEVTRRDASVERVQAFIDERLRSCFVKTAQPRVLKNSNQSPLFSLCFAASNPKGAPIAIRIANSILAKD
jgi:three-Cys-motif partner protein